MRFVDEAQHIVGGIMLDRGGILYRSFVDAHGPAIFMAVQAYGAVFGWSHPNGVRAISVVLAACSAGAVVASAALTNMWARVAALSLFLGLVSTVWLMQALFMVNYHAMAGFLASTALALTALPLWLGRRVGASRMFLAGACFVLVAATAYSFVPAVVLLSISVVLASPTRKATVALLAGGLAAGLAVLIWLAVFGDIAGYIVFHVLINQFVFSKYIPFGFHWFLSSLLPSMQPIALVHSMALLNWTMALVLMLALNRARPAEARDMLWPIVVGFAGLLALCARGGTLFQDGSFVVCTIVAVAVVVPVAWGHGHAMQRLMPRDAWHVAGTCLLGGWIAIAELSMRHALASPWEITRAQMILQPRFNLGQTDEPVFAKIRTLTHADERILAVPFSPGVYLAAGRMPMDGFSYYLPWDAEYAKHPWLGVTHDLCAGMAKTTPKLIFFDDWFVWNRFAMADYPPCFARILASDYRRQADFPVLYLRRPDLGP